MTRLSLSPEPAEWQQGRYRFRDDDSSDDSSKEEDFVAVSSEDDCRYSDSDDDDMVYEYPHPVGFPAQAHSSWGRTRLCLDPTMTSELIEEEWDQSYSMTARPTTVMIQSYPPLETSYIDPKTAPTSALLQYNTHQQRKVRLQEEDDRDMDQITQLLAAASIVDTAKVQALVVQPPQVTTSPLDVLASMAQKVQQNLKEEKRRMQKEQMEAARALQMLLDHNNRAADNILRKEQQQEADENERLRKEEEEEDIRKQKEAEHRRVQDEKEEADAEVARNNIAAAKAKEDAVKAKEAAKTEYIEKAKKLVAQLVQLRASIEPFEKSKAVGKRRLNMKKIVRGKVNTLAENAEKIKSVAAEVSKAIAEARAEDEDLKAQLQAGNTQIAPEMTRGKRYLVDLLASSIMVRVQAEGFNGLRGDGFPIANMMALVSTESKELVPIMAAHIYTVCPTAIPKLPTPASDSSEEGLMKSLGMAQDKNGEYETFNRFLQRTEGIISFVSNIMASNPPSHQLMGGHKGAVDWLSRFLRILPAPPQTPLPLLTASVLDAFLTGAGHMLANMHPEHFKKHLDVITNDIVNRLDDGPMGAPSAIRLKKTVKDGFEGFKIKLPSKALPELYYGANGSSGGHGGHGGGVSQPSSSFGSGSATQSAANPFGGGGSKPPAATPDPFGGGGGGGGGGLSSFSSQPSNPFGGGGGGNTSAPSPFAAQASNNPSPFGGGPSAGQPSGMGDSSGMQDDMNSNAFGNPSPFGGGGTSASSGFGSPAPSSGFGAAPAPAPQSGFGGNSGGGSFGQPQGFGQQQQPGLGSGNSTPFGSASNASPFGGQPQASSNPSPFGASPFGGGGASNPSPFSSSNNTSSFGGNSSGGFGQPQGFGQQQQQPGLGSSISTPFGSSANASPFGVQPQAISNPSPFGASPFGGGGGAPNNPSPFSSNNNASGFGGNSGGGRGGFGGNSGGGRGGRGGGNST